MSSKAIIAVLLSDTKCAAELAAGLGADGFHVMIAKSPEELHQIVKCQRADLVVLGNDPGGF